MNTPKPPVIVIAGPTASGKSALAMALSSQMPITIINADASQLYADLRIVTARPSAEDEAKVPHRLFGILDGREACSAADWANLAKAEIRAVHDEERTPVLVGGTGLYLRTLIDGIAPVPPIDPEVRDQIRSLATNEAYAALTREDAEAANRIGSNDTARIARALEVVRSTGKPLRDWQAIKTGGIGEVYTIKGIVLLPPRDWLRARCDARFVAMLNEGAEGEVAALSARQLPNTAPIMRAIGVREIMAMAASPAQRETLIAEAQAATRQYAKRQYTWFRHQAPPHWERIESALDDKIIDKVAIKLRQNILTR
jgi:tRNA dimethylallyltransferase